MIYPPSNTLWMDKILHQLVDDFHSYLEGFVWGGLCHDRGKEPTSKSQKHFFEASNTIQQSIVAGSSVFLHFKTIEWIILAVETIHCYYFGNSLYSTQQNLANQRPYFDQILGP